MTQTQLGSVLARVDKLADLVRAEASACEHVGHLTPAVFDALHEADLFRMLVPREFDGPGLTLPEAITVLERLARADASTAWTVAIVCSGPLFMRRMSADAYERLSRDRNALACGTLNPVTAQAERVDGGYCFNGKATYLSGSAHAQYVMASAIVTNAGDNGLHFRSGVFPIENARSLDTWHVTGMCATGSTDYEFDDIFVPDDWTFDPFANATTGDEVFDVIPMWAQVGGVVAACAVGAARNMRDRFIELAGGKVPVGGMSRLAERPQAQHAVGEASGLYQAARAVLFESAAFVWARGVAREPFDNDALARQRLGLVTAVHLSARAIDLLHDAAGMSAVAQDSVLARCWRDVHTMTQHIILATPRYAIAGRVLLGLDPDAPVI